SLRTRSRVRAKPAYCTVVGKALLARAPNETQVMLGKPLQELRPHPQSTRRTLRLHPYLFRAQRERLLQNSTPKYYTRYATKFPATPALPRLGHKHNEPVVPHIGTTP